MERARLSNSNTLTRLATIENGLYLLSVTMLSHLRNRVQITGDLNPGARFRVVIPIGRRRVLVRLREECDVDSWLCTEVSAHILRAG